MNAVEGVWFIRRINWRRFRFPNQFNYQSLVNEPVISQNSGNVYFAGVILNPGYKGGGAKIFSVNFRVKASGDAFITVANGSVLANDGSGTQVLSSIFGGRYKLEPKIITPALLRACCGGAG